MKEVKLGRVAGPYYQGPPFENYIQSPVGLVPKAGGQTRLIFHLSFDFKSGNLSVNGRTPDKLCTVTYNDLDAVIRNSLRVLGEAGMDLISGGVQNTKTTNLYYLKSDLVSTF